MTRTVAQLTEEIERRIKRNLDANGVISCRLLEWQRDRLCAERTIRVLALADRLVAAYLKTGSMTVRLPDNSSLTDRPHTTGNSIQDAYNLLGKAEDMAWMATADRPPLSVVPPRVD